MLSVPPAAAQIDLPSMHADPSKYMLYRCPQLAQARPSIVSRMQELERLTAKAATDPGGAIIGRMTYRSEYLMLQGDLHNLDRRAAELDCPPAPAGGGAQHQPRHRLR
jgi:hypothetical protein